MSCARAAVGFIIAAVISEISPFSFAEDKPATATAPADKPAITIPLRRGRDRLFAKAVINGTDIGFLCIDTGATMTGIDSDIAKRLGAATIGRRWVNTQEGDRLFDVAVAKSVKIGPLELHDQVLYIAPGESYANPAKEVLAGVVGMDLMGKQPFQIDFRQASMSFFTPGTFQPPQEAAEFPLQPNLSNPVVAARVENCAGRFSLDTGHTYGYRLSPAFVRLNEHLVHGRPHMNESVAWTQPADIYSVQWESFEALGRTIKPVAGDYEVGPKGIDGVAGLIGPGFFRDCQLMIDMQAAKLWIKKKSATESPEEFLRRFPVNAPRDLDGFTSLLHAAIRLNAPAAEKLLQQGADVNAVDYAGMSSLLIAAGRGDPDLARVLLKSGAKLDLRTKTDEFTALLLAARYGQRELVAMLLDAKDDINVASKTGRTPLFVAADADHFDTVKLLIERGAKVDKALSSGETPLMAAARNGSVNVVSLLLDNGADPNKVVASGSPLIYAAQSASAQCVKRLLDESAGVNDPRPDGLTPLAAAAQSYRAAECVKLLLDAGADVNAKSRDGRTVLDFAVQSGSPQAVSLILSRVKPKTGTK